MAGRQRQDPASPGRPLPRSCRRPGAATRPAQAGFSLIIAVSIISLLSLVGMMILEQSIADVQLAGADRAAHNSLYIAEAGAIWGQQQVADLLFPPGTSTADKPQAGSLTGLPTLPANDPLCPENSCITPPCPPPIDCSQFYLLTPSWVDYGGGRYRAAASCTPSCSAGLPRAYTVRALGQAASGAARLVEVVSSP